MGAHPCCLTLTGQGQVLQDETHEGCCDEFVTGLGRRLRVNWVAGSLYPYDVIIYIFCIELILYSKDVTFIYVQ
jgi:hypothetical protein